MVRRGASLPVVRAGVDWRFIYAALVRFGLPLLFALTSLLLAKVYAEGRAHLWSDAHIYFRATDAWLAGGNPWVANLDGITYAAPPPALFLNLPLVPFGENVAVVVWAIAGSIAAVGLIRRLGLPWWWLLFYPISEGWAGASPDLVLAILVYLGLGPLAALTKPYAIPAMLGERRWRAIVIAGVLVVVTIPILPWSMFFASSAAVNQAFATWTSPSSAWGNVPLMAAASIALLSLRWRRGLALFTPAIIAQQPHYAVFSLSVLSSSPILAALATMPVAGAAAIGVIAYAALERLRPSI